MLAVSSKQPKPCPFCKGEGTYLDGEEHPDKWSFAGCQACDIWFDDTDPGGALAAWNRRADEWISVEERLPELDSYGFHDGKVFFYSGEVLVCKAGEKWKFLATYDELYGWISDIGDRLEGITHWMGVTPPPAD